MGVRSKDESETLWFDAPLTSLFKTLTMFVGELEFASLPIDPSTSLSLLTYAFFLAFVFMTVVILMNLLNGLAVADVGDLHKNAVISSIKSR